MSGDKREKAIPLVEVIGKTITNIYCIYGSEDGWLDTSECFIELDNQIYISIPYGKQSTNCIKELSAEAKTIFDNLSDIPVHSLNDDGKEYKVEYRENKLKNILNQTIVDYLWLDEKSGKGFFKLHNGYLISETIMAPYGTGLAGLNYYDNIDSLIESKGKKLSSLSTDQNT